MGTYLLNVACGGKHNALPAKPLHEGGDIVAHAEECPFCAELQHIRELNEYLVKSGNRPGKTRIEYRVALVQNTNYNGYSSEAAPASRSR